MKKMFVVLALLFFVPAVSFGLFGSLINDAVGGAVHDAVKGAKNEAVKSADPELKAVIDQAASEMKPEAVLKALKAELAKEFKLGKSDLLMGKVEYGDENIDGDPGKYTVTISLQALRVTIVVTADSRSKTDMDSWQSDLKGQKESADMVNTVYKNILDWSPYAAKPYIITVLAVKDGSLEQDSYDRALKAIKTVFPGLLKPPSSLWFITE